MLAPTSFSAACPKRNEGHLAFAVALSSAAAPAGSFDVFNAAPLVAPFLFKI